MMEVEPNQNNDLYLHQYRLNAYLYHNAYIPLDHIFFSFLTIVHNRIKV